MDKSVNKVELVGRLGSDPKITQWEDGRNMMRVNLATNETFKSKTGEIKEEVTWHRIVAWSGKDMPDFSNLKKGMKLRVIGKIHVTSFDAADGNRRQWTEIMATGLSQTGD